jgi:hypothetical protein
MQRPLWRNYGISRHCGDRTSSAGRLADGAPVMALSPAGRKGLLFYNHAIKPILRLFVAGGLSVGE